MTITYASRWRESSGHAVSEYDPVSQKSLAERVCDGDKSLHVSGIQMALIEDIQKYLKPGEVGISSYFTGQVLCMVALVCWYLMVAKEVSHALALHRGINNVARGKNKLEPRENPFTQITHYRLTSITRRRVVASYILLLYRLIAATALIFVGTYFLVYTVNVTELILNAVALEIILDIDDLIFDALATTPGRHLVHHLEPLPMPSFPRWRGADSKSLFMSLLIPGILFLVYFQMLAPMVQTLQSVSDELCGGNQKFVWRMDQRNITVFAETSGTGWEESNTMQIAAIHEAQGLSGPPGNQTQHGVWLNTVGTLLDDSTLSLDELIDKSNTQCVDLATDSTLLNYLRQGLDDQTIMGCADALPYCSSVSKMPGWGVDGGRGFFTRMLCSKTCGCLDPGGDFLFVQGCPYGSKRPCQTSSEFQAVLQTTACVERTADELRSFQPWVRWIEQLRSYADVDQGLDGQAEAKLLAQAMWDHGCGFGANLTAQNISWGTCVEWNPLFAWEFKTLDYFCPITCDCDNAPGSSCPLPQGYTCRELSQSDCLYYDSYYYCDGEVETIKGIITLSFTDPFSVTAQQAMYEQAMKMTLASAAGDGVIADMITTEVQDVAPGPAPERRLQATIILNFIMYLIFPGLSKGDVEQTLASYAADQLSVMYLVNLADMGIDVVSSGVSVAGFFVPVPPAQPP